ncbi:MAG TPA: tyrosine-type recombinase/integrase [Brumimicrobium sp.]|nr:tyrosine-type recombinase/integrase [Brumimicrobium sp.]
MSKIKRNTTSTFLPWEDFTGLMLKLERDGEFKFLLLMATGTMTALRIGDVLGLKWEQLLNQESFRIQEGKTKKIRQIPISKDLQGVIQKCYLKMGKPDVEELMFLNKYKTKTIRIQWVNVKLKQIFKKYGLPTKGVSSHLFRKTLGRASFENNGSSEDSLIKLSELFGHSSIAVTRRYLGLRQEEIDDLYLGLKL